MTATVNKAPIRSKALIPHGCKSSVQSIFFPLSAFLKGAAKL